MKGIVFAILLVFCICVIQCREKEFTIQNIPYHRQITRYACGDASFEMVYHHFKQDLDQRAIIDVARTSFPVGTSTFDLIRAAHFSELSSSAANHLYPSQAPTKGWKKSIPHGMGAFGYYSDECWIEELKDVISQGYPVIVLNEFSETSPGGHFRVAMGYDENSITLLDPWDRLWPRIVTFSNEEFCSFIWKIPEKHYNFTTPPYWGGIIAPLSIDLSFTALNKSRGFDEKQYNYIVVHSSISYPCPAPFCTQNHPQNANEFIIQNFNVSLSLPFNMKIIDGEAITSIESFAPTSTLQFSWEIEIDDSIDIKFPTYSNNLYNDDNVEGDGIIRVTAAGLINGFVPEAVCCYNNDGSLKYFPAYSYSDIIGNVAEIHY